MQILSRDGAVHSVAHPSEKHINLNDAQPDDTHSSYMLRLYHTQETDYVSAKAYLQIRAVLNV